MDGKVSDWVWHDARDPRFSKLPALVVALDGAPRSRGANTVCLMFDGGSTYWLSRDHIRPCSRDQAIKARSEAQATDPNVNTVEQVEENARRWRERRAAKRA